MEKSPPPYAPYPAQGPSNPPYPTGNQGFPQPQQQQPYQGQPGGAYPPQQPLQPGYYPPQQMQPVSTQNHTTVVMAGGTAGLIPGQCPVCRAGMLNSEFTCCGICCAICFFPIGLICLFTMKETRCAVCRANF